MWMKKRRSQNLLSAWYGPGTTGTALHTLVFKSHNNIFYDWGNNGSGRSSDFIRD